MNLDLTGKRAVMRVPQNRSQTRPHFVDCCSVAEFDHVIMEQCPGWDLNPSMESFRLPIVDLRRTFQVFC